MLVCIIRHEDMEIYILVENVNMDVLVEIYINDLEIVKKMDNIYTTSTCGFIMCPKYGKCI
jgi:hypothetical protein